MKLIPLLYSTCNVATRRDLGSSDNGLRHQINNSSEEVQRVIITALLRNMI